MSPILHFDLIRYQHVDKAHALGPYPEPFYLIWSDITSPPVWYKKLYLYFA